MKTTNKAGKKPKTTKKEVVTENIVVKPTSVKVDVEVQSEKIKKIEGTHQYCDRIIADLRSKYKVEILSHTNEKIARYTLKLKNKQ